MASRLTPVLKKHGCESYRQYLKLVESSNESYIREFISAMTTNTTHFFREDRHFEYLKAILPQIINKKRRQGSHEIRIWCAASSTGQEAYSILFTLLESFTEINRWSLRFLASDIDTNALEFASQGRYSLREITGLAPDLRKKYCLEEPGKDLGEPVFHVLPQLRKKIVFSEFNLLSPSYPFQFPFDIIFCRNVLIYFNRTTSKGVVDRLKQSLDIGGYLFVGHTESGFVDHRILKQVSSSVYKRVG
jgi:chemotaxis protein methyltransferase CheR